MPKACYIIIQCQMFILLLGSFACGGSTKKRQEQHDSIKGKYSVIDTGFMSRKGTSPLDFFLNTYADSLNRLYSGRLPEFLKDVQFDYNFSGISANSNVGLPLRKVIFDRVTNCQSLLMIISDTSAVYKNHPVKQNYIKIDSAQYSNFELAKMRLRKLNCP